MIFFSKKLRSVVVYTFLSNNIGNIATVLGGGGAAIAAWFTYQAAKESKEAAIVAKNSAGEMEKVQKDIHEEHKRMVKLQETVSKYYSGRIADRKAAIFNKALEESSQLWKKLPTYIPKDLHILKNLEGGISILAIRDYLKIIDVTDGGFCMTNFSYSADGTMSIHHLEEGSLVLINLVLYEVLDGELIKKDLLSSGFNDRQVESTRRIFFAKTLMLDHKDTPQLLLKDSDFIAMWKWLVGLKILPPRVPFLEIEGDLASVKWSYLESILQDCTRDKKYNNGIGVWSVSEIYFEKEDVIDL